MKNSVNSEKPVTGAADGNPEPSPGMFIHIEKGATTIETTSTKRRKEVEYTQASGSAEQPVSY